VEKHVREQRVRNFKNRKVREVRKNSVFYSAFFSFLVSGTGTVLSATGSTIIVMAHYVFKI